MKRLNIINAAILGSVVFLLANCTTNPNRMETKDGNPLSMAEARAVKAEITTPTNASGTTRTKANGTTFVVTSIDTYEQKDSYKCLGSLQNLAKYRVEYRTYTEWQNGEAVRTWSGTHRTFLGCR